MGFRFPLLIKINRGHVRHVMSVKFLHVLFSYTRIYITFNSTSPAFYFSFTVSLFVCDHFKGPYSSSEREIKFRRCLFTSTIKREIRHFHVVVVQKRERNVKKVWCTCEVVLLLINPIVFLTFSLLSASLDLKVPNYFSWTRRVRRRTTRRKRHTLLISRLNDMYFIRCTSYVEG